MDKMAMNDDLIRKMMLDDIKCGIYNQWRAGCSPAEMKERSKSARVFIRAIAD